MKNKYVIIGMIIITAVVVMLGVYEIINSVGYDDDINRTVADNRNTLIEILMDTEYESDRNEMIDFFTYYSIISKN